jgi:hypothetical protein
MNLLAWVMMGIAIWHFAVFVPDHFWGGIVGAFAFAVVGALLTGVILAGGEIDDPSLVTALEAIPGTIGALAVSYYIGKRREDPGLIHTR